jgi:hypothetical protein
MPIFLLALSAAPAAAWLASLAIASLARRQPPPVEMRSERLAAWSYTGTFCVLWATAILIVSLWPVTR